MSILAERIHSLCEQLKLNAVATDWPTLAQSAAQDEQSYADFLEAVLRTESKARHVRSQQTMTRMAGFPAIKTLDAFDFMTATGECLKKLSCNLRHWHLSNAGRTSCCWVPVAWAKHTWRLRWAI